MTGASVVVATGSVDAHGVTGSGGFDRRWDALGIRPLDPDRAWRALFGTANRTFRRLDPMSRALLVAAEAAGMGGVLPESVREETALIVGSVLGSLDADLRFQASLAPGREPEAARFPYTLPSTAVGELAMRHGLRGPSLFLSLDDDPDEPFAEARLRVEAGEVPAAVAARVEAVGEEVAPDEVGVLAARLVVLRARR
ncbi:MAG: beta-ketoacyl synthase N-terminal-like domain-containing protein [Planctomycetota bacterium JB042]